MIFDAYTARMRAQLPPADPAAADEVLLDHLERTSIIDRAIADVDARMRLIEDSPGGLIRERSPRTSPPLRTRLQELADVAQDAGVRVSIEHHPRPGAAPRG